MRARGVVLRVLPAVLVATLAASCTTGDPHARSPDRATTAPTAAPSAGSSAAGSGLRTATRTPSPMTGWGPSQADVEAARRSVTAMTVEQAAGQVLVARYDGTTPQRPAALVRDLHLAGVILMGDNVADPAQVRATAAAVQDAALRDGRTWPAVVAVDQEGGAVARVGEPATPFPSLMTSGAARRPDLTRAAASASGVELRSLGFTWVFAPVADVTSGPDDPTIGSRAASDDPQVVSQVVQAALGGYVDAGIVAVAKHYPGHGSVPADSHRELPVQRADLQRLRARDLVPFAGAVRAGAPAVMMSHVAVQALDPGVPASLSPASYRLLRTETGFDGVAVTDALDMAAVARRHGSGPAAVAALAAGADLLLMPPDVRAAHTALVQAVAQGAVSRARLDEAASRVVALARWQGTTAAATTRTGAPDPLGTHAEVSAALSAAGVTVLSGPCAGRLVGEAVQVAGGGEADRAAFLSAARDAGLRVGSGDVVRLLGGPTSSGDGDVVVALDAPYGLASSRATTARLALYGRTPQAFQALVGVLVGSRPAPGRSPVDVPGLPRTAC